ncbi:HAD family hydrolase [Prevotella sp. HUN102]|uniref:HAD family hydrolase n=1 Tax=Prevotella sp. HUN102 TaxID=1392486 RepID=UPI00055C5D58|nr:HAD family hydrolase [Prevotella sp. HUN102]
MDIKGYIFDYGGTLDTAGCHWGKMIWHAYERHNIPVTEDMFREAYVYAERTLGRKPVIQPDYNFHKTLEMKLRIEFDYLVEKGYITETGFSLASKRSAVLEDLYAAVKETTGKSREILLKLKEKYPLVLVSNFYGNISVVLEEFGLDGIFGKIIESAAVDVRKPDPRIFQMGVDAVGLKADEVMVVGDSYKKDIVPAHSIGCQTVWLKGEGWVEENYPDCVADRIIASLKEL